MKLLTTEDEQGLRESIEACFTEAGNFCEQALYFNTDQEKISLYTILF